MVREVAHRATSIRNVSAWCGSVFWGLVKRFSPRHYYQHCIDRVYEHWNPQIDAAYADFKQAEAAGLTGIRDREAAEYVDGLFAYEWQRLYNRAQVVHLNIRDMPVPEGETTHWTTNPSSGCPHVIAESMRKFAWLVEEREHEKAKRRREAREGWMKWITAVAAVAGAFASIYVAVKGRT